MDKVYIKSDEKVRFLELLDILSFLQKHYNDNFYKLAEIFESVYPMIKVEESCYGKRFDDVYFYFKDLEIDYKDSFLVGVSDYHIFISSKRYKEKMNQLSSKKVEELLGLYMRALKNISFSSEICDGEYFFSMELCSSKLGDGFDLNSLCGKIMVRSNEKVDVFYYDFLHRTLGVKKDRNFVALPKHVAEKVLSALNTASGYELPSGLVGFLNIAAKRKCKSRRTGEYLDENFLRLLLFEDVYYELDFSLKEKGKNTDVSFMDYIGKNNAIGTFNNMTTIKESIKAILTNLKESGAVLDYIKKIKIPDTMYFSEVSSERKVIDPFFFDPDILKNCDLSGIDFTNADICGAYLAGSGAQIDLSKIYGNSIEGANLENVCLAGQALDFGINANNANLKGTRVTVCLDGCSICGTKFGTDANFLMGISFVDDETLALMGINIEKSEPTLSLAREQKETKAEEATN